MSQVRRAQSEQADSAEWPDRGPGNMAMMTVTIRMPVAMVEALKSEAQQQGVRGYQTLMKLWIEERLDGDRLIAARRLMPLLRSLHHAEEALRRLMAEAPPDH